MGTCPLQQVNAIRIPAMSDPLRYLQLEPWLHPFPEAETVFASGEQNGRISPVRVMAIRQAFLLLMAALVCLALGGCTTIHNISDAALARHAAGALSVTLALNVAPETITISNRHYDVLGRLNFDALIRGGEREEASYKCEFVDLGWWYPFMGGCFCPVPQDNGQIVHRRC